MQREDMVITESWRWRLLAIWAIIFTFLVSYALFEVHQVSDDNRDSLCRVHLTHIEVDRALIILMERGGMNVEAIQHEIERERDAFARRGCAE